MEWFILVLAGMFEVLGVFALNKISEKKELKWFALLLGGFAISLTLLTFAMKTIPMGTAYAVWTGIGTVGGVLLGMFFYGESKDWLRILFISMVVVAAIGLKLIS
ncbi:QacE family quaternary ammonium compound efflux SMR transporter [Pueribacillus theae]|uniref:QacE family quaternary ammonium compound efflux SMR transporter n=1 Tax=Pueribacillus theae TaxID=2171751 RepID=A0A2U1K4B9_9BACI|nr:multidrug efflux SMR transporter [Pueribacillus theae]PWA12034.1 QacE family quaternary ammonium compound efflux SMR transporter [Pueribacillus theae]